MAHIEFNTYKELKQYIAKDLPREGKYTVTTDETMQNKKSVYNYMNGELMLDSGGTRDIHWVAGVGTYADIALTHLTPVGLDACVVTVDETHSDNKTWYIYNGDTEVWDYQGPYYRQEAQEYESLTDTRAEIITGELDLGFDYMVGANELDLYIDGEHSNYLLQEVGDLGFTSTKVSFTVDIPKHVDLVIRKVVSKLDDEPQTNPEVFVNTVKSNWDAIDRFMKYEKSVVIEYNNFAEVLADTRLKKEGQVIRTFGHVTKNDGRGRYWILEVEDKDYGFKTADGTLFINRVIGADEKQIGEMFPLATGLTAPPESLPIQGQIVNRNDHKRIWAWAQATGRVVTEAEWTAGNKGAFSSGDGSTTFRFPDSRGVFIRPLDNGAGIDSGRANGSLQGDAIRNITGQLGIGDGLHSNPAATDGGTGALTSIASAGTTYVSTSNPANRTYGISLDASRQVPTAAENRPTNIAEPYYIKV